MKDTVPYKGLIDRRRGPRIRDIDGRVWRQSWSQDARSWRELKWTAGEYQLEWRKQSPGDTPDTGWYLYGVGIFGKFMAKRLYEAIFEAGAHINSPCTPCRLAR